MSGRVRSVLLLALPLEAGYLALSRLHDWQRSVVEYIAVYLATSIFYIVSCWWITEKNEKPESRRQLAAILLAGLAFRLTLLPLYPSLTEDPHRYRWEGKLQAAGGNPYVARPEDPQWAGLRDSTWPRVNRKDLPTAYGPLLEWSHRLTYAVVSRLEPNEFRQVWLFKIPYLVFDLATMGALLGLLAQLGRPRSWVLIYAWSPLVVAEFWASAHNDPVLVFFLVAAIWAAGTERWAWAMGALWMATLAKFWPALLFPLFLWSGGRARLSGRLGWVLAWTPLAALLSLPYWQGSWQGPAQLRGMLAGFLGGWRNNPSLYNVIYAVAGRDYEQGKPLVAGLLVAAVLAIAVRRPALPQGVLATTVVLLFLSANCFPWYLTWMVPLLATYPLPAFLLWTALAPLAYHILVGYQATGRWQDDPFYLYLEYVPVYGMLLARLIQWGVKKAFDR